MKLIVHGLGRMGMQIARKLSEDGHTVIALNRSPQPVEIAMQYGATGAHTKEEALGHFSGSEQVIVWLMLPSELNEAMIREWTELLPDHSILINGANSDYRTTQALTRQYADTGVTFVDAGVSGGVWGYQNGFPIMVGGDNSEAITTLTPILDSLAKPNGAWRHFGPAGAGNYVKMVHNAIEYGMMQSLAEGYQLLREGPYSAIDLAAAGDVWQHHSVISSWLNELSMQAVAENPAMDGISGYVAESGEARWALETAESLGIKTPAIRAAFDVRLNSQKGDVNYATKLVAAQRNKFGGHSLNGEGAA